MGIQENKERFISIFNDKVQREGADKLLSYLCSDSCDFFTAPASTRFTVPMRADSASTV